MYQGTCQCQSVKYQLTGDPLTCYTCHCTDCQTSSGSAFTLSMIVNSDDLSVVDGEISVQYFDHNGTEVGRYHCKKCGSALWYRAKVMPQFSAIKPGTFEDTKWFKPVAHLWTRSAQPWVTFEPDIKKYETQPEMQELIELWSQSQQ